LAVDGLLLERPRQRAYPVRVLRRFS